MSSATVPRWWWLSHASLWIRKQGAKYMVPQWQVTLSPTPQNSIAYIPPALVLDLRRLGLSPRRPPLRSIMVPLFFPRIIFLRLTTSHRVCILSCFAIYLMSGAEIFKKRKELRAFHSSHDEPYASYKTTQIAVTSSELNPVLPFSSTIDQSFDTPSPPNTSLLTARTQDADKNSSSSAGSAVGKAYEQYSINIASPPAANRPSLPQSMVSVQARKRRAAMEVNRAAWGYTKVALLFFVSLLVTWVLLTFPPSSASLPLALGN